MTFAESIKTGFSKFATFSGRASLSEFWWWGLFIVLIGSGLIKWGHASVWIKIGLLGALSVPSSAVMVRRLHDINRSGWWIILWFFFIMMPSYMDLSDDGPGLLGFPDTQTEALYMLLALVIIGISFLIAMSWPGTKGANRFGADPLSEKCGQ